MYEKFIKRILDIVISLVGLLVLSPAFLVLFFLVRTKLGKPAIFRQNRPGKIDRKTGEEKIFGLCKFRSMTDARGGDGELLSDEERLTPFGAKLRATSLDELPELWNILKGDMSLVGPRPLLVRYLPRYTKQQRRRHNVRPGLTGWAQVNGRNAISWEQKFEYDVWYAEHVSFALDAKIFFMTIKAVLARQGISGEGSATMGEFMGSCAPAEQSKKTE